VDGLGGLEPEGGVGWSKTSKGADAHGDLWGGWGGVGDGEDRGWRRMVQLVSVKINGGKRWSWESVKGEGG